MVDVGERNEALRERQRALQAEQSLRRQIEEIERASRALAETLASAESPKPSVLQTIVERARILVDAEYVALGVAKGPGELFEPFVYAGVDERVREALGRTPRAVGVFALVVRTRRPIRLRGSRRGTRR